MAKVDNIKLFHNILKSISTADTTLVQCSENGIKLTLEEGKTLQIMAYFKARNSIFCEYNFERTDSEDSIAFGLNLKVVVENLHIFCDTNSTTTLVYKGAGSPFVMLLEHEAEQFTTECMIKTRNTEEMMDLGITRDNQTCKLELNAPFLFNLLRDLSTASPHSEQFEICIQSAAPHFAIKSLGSVDIETGLTMNKSSDMIKSFMVSDPAVVFKFSYKWNHLKTLLKILAFGTTVLLVTNKEGLLGLEVTIDDDQNNQSYLEIFLCPLKEDDDVDR